jgi:hypothetical protein
LVGVTAQLKSPSQISRSILMIYLGSLESTDFQVL